MTTTFILPADADPEAQWVARLNYLGQLIDEQAQYEDLFEPTLTGQPRKPSKELRQLMAQWRALARQNSGAVACY